jgi:Flp pilus assembly secretin CpaC
VAVPLDEVRVITFAHPVSTLYVGNPVIADVTIIDSRHAFVQGKAFGATNIVALDAAGRQIANSQIVVAGSGTAVVTLQRGMAQTTYACAASRCQTAPQPGDGKDAYDAATDQITKHQAMLAKAASDGQ